MKKGSIVLVLIIVSTAGAVWLQRKMLYIKEPVPEQVDIREIQETPQNVVDTVDMLDKVEVVEIPDELNLAMPFYSQAPYANWDYPWQEACEEASVLLVANEYYGHKWDRQEFNSQILDIVDWEVETFGAYEHTNVDQTVQMLDDYLGLKSIVHEDPTFDDVQNVLAQGHFIVMTFAGKELGNPNYTNGGPEYHAMVIKGYKKGQKIITHDVGTRRGEDYVYTWDVIQNALHDYADPIQLGAKRMIEVLPPDDLQ